MSASLNHKKGAPRGLRPHDAPSQGQVTYHGDITMTTTTETNALTPS